MFGSEYCSTVTVGNAVTLMYELQERANQDKFGIAAEFLTVQAILMSNSLLQNHCRAQQHWQEHASNPASAAV